MATAGGALEQGVGHLRAPGVLDADEEDVAHGETSCLDTTW